MYMNYCRKIFATYLHQKRTEQEIIDLLQGHIPKSIFVRHYYRPDLESLERVRKCLIQLKKLII
jgi:intergrase/recombinase